MSLMKELLRYFEEPRLSIISKELNLKAICKVKDLEYLDDKILEGCGKLTQIERKKLLNLKVQVSLENELRTIFGENDRRLEFISNKLIESGIITKEDIPYIKFNCFKDEFSEMEMKKLERYIKKTIPDFMMPNYRENNEKTKAHIFQMEMIRLESILINVQLIHDGKMSLLRAYRVLKSVLIDLRNKSCGTEAAIRAINQVQDILITTIASPSKASFILSLVQGAVVSAKELLIYFYDSKLKDEQIKFLEEQIKNLEKDMEDQEKLFLLEYNQTNKMTL